MKIAAISTLAFGFVGLTAIILVAIGAPGSHIAPPSPAPAAPAPSSVSEGGFTLASTSVDLPIDETQYPDGLHADVINANCTTCHSASMALNQPALSQNQWKAEVTKMREVYKAPIAEADVAAIVTYLTTMSSKLPSAASVRPSKVNNPAGRNADATSG